MDISDMVHNDLSKIAELEKECFSCPWSVNAIYAELQKKDAVFIVARIDGQIAGYMGMNFVLDEGYIDNVAVSKMFRRSGVASSLLDHMFIRAKELALSFMTLEVRESNIPAISLYSQNGFCEVGRRRGFYDNPVEDAILMTVYIKQEKGTV